MERKEFGRAGMERVGQEKWLGLIQNLLDTQAPPGPSGHLCSTTALSWASGLDAPDRSDRQLLRAHACADPRCWSAGSTGPLHLTSEKFVMQIRFSSWLR